MRRSVRRRLRSRHRRRVVALQGPGRRHRPLAGVRRRARDRDRQPHVRHPPGGAGDVTKTNMLWRHTDATADIASPVSDGKRVWLAAGSGLAACLGAADGKLLWEQELGTPTTASPIVAGSNVYFFGQDGVTRVLRPATRTSRRRRAKSASRSSSRPPSPMAGLHPRRETPGGREMTRTGSRHAVPGRDGPSKGIQ